MRERLTKQRNTRKVEEKDDPDNRKPTLMCLKKAKLLV